MKCEKCGGSWIPPKGISKFLDNCPFLWFFSFKY